MGKKEALQKKIDKLDRKLKFYYSIIFGIISGIVWSIYAIMESKADYRIVILSFCGLIVIIIIAIIIRKLEKLQDKLIEELERE